ncbi:MAG TPA: 2OG-Fe(II) oxygenase [Caulobacter sp.]|nr:2OG-Fe(II) oxygenase [Caulobacter sp.]
MALTPGDPAPHFRAPSPGNPAYGFNTVGGRFVALAFLPPVATPTTAAALNAVRSRRRLFDDERLCFFGVISDPAAIARARDEVPGIRWFHDPGGEIARIYEIEAPGWVIVDPSLRVLFTAPLDQSDAVLARLAALPAIDDHAGAPLHAPVLIAPRIFEPAFCRVLIDAYEAVGGTPSGFMREVDGRTVVASDPAHKRRSDVTIEDEGLRQAARARINRRLVPLIRQAFQYAPTRMERYLVARYDADGGGWFRPHRDNTTRGTAHRQFAVSINLDAEAHEGGDLRFPEFGSRTYRPPTGGAVVFSCSLLHEATPVTAGRRYAFLPFLYDEAGAQLREANAAFVDPSIGGYRADVEAGTDRDQS